MELKVGHDVGKVYRAPEAAEVPMPFGIVIQVKREETENNFEFEDSDYEPVNIDMSAITFTREDVVLPEDDGNTQVTPPNLHSIPMPFGILKLQEVSPPTFGMDDDEFEINLDYSADWAGLTGALKVEKEKF